MTRPLPLSLSHTDERGAVGIRVLAVLPARELQATGGPKKVSHQEARQFLLSPSDLSVSRKRQTAAGRDRIKWDMTRLRARMNNSDIKPRKCVYRRECCCCGGNTHEVSRDRDSETTQHSMQAGTTRCSVSERGVEGGSCVSRRLSAYVSACRFP